jgi:hypothetical protein
MKPYGIPYGKWNLWTQVFKYRFYNDGFIVFVPGIRMVWGELYN